MSKSNDDGLVMCRGSSWPPMGAYDPMKHLGLSDWPRVAAMDCDALHDLLAQCQAWEAEIDPSGRLLPREKRHDDKSLAAVLPGA